MSPHVWIFKVQATARPDDYAIELAANSFAYTFIPVLDHASTSLPVLAETLLAGPQPYNGLILTSQRAVQAVSGALGSLVLSPDTVLAWSMLPVFVVGPRTASDLRQIDLFSSSTITVADRATELCDAIQASLPVHNQSLLFLSGDKRRDVIPRRMAEASIKVHEIKSYATCPHPLLKEHLDTIKPCLDDWAVYFSPSGIRFIVDALGSLPVTKVAAIGPTTAEYLEQLGLTVHVVADHPDAVHLVSSMAAYDASNPT
ncbi:tetrapyrrole biosynthesis, uroporphyrinogen III synthase [Phycomyces nitens]|nr:tetrapyrrole biosynthesis, uroporphyrinogen III synthase [Phycomyces nitens]